MVSTGAVGEQDRHQRRTTVRGVTVKGLVEVVVVMCHSYSIIGGKLINPELCCRLISFADGNTEEGALQLIDDSFAQLNQSGEAQFGGGVNWQKTSRTSSQPISDKTRTTFPAPAAATATSAAAVTNGGNESQWPTAFVRNELHLGTVEDANHGQLYLCRTSNSNLSKPLDSIVRLQIYSM